MLFILRMVIVMIYSILLCIFGCIYCLFSPRHPRHVSTFSHLFGKLSVIFGITVELRKSINKKKYSNAIYICNHQNNYDMITVAKIVLPNTVTVGKSTLLWVPFFGQLYWITGNILINRKNKTKAYTTINVVVNHFKNKKISFLMFPEGTRSRGRGLMPFKNGAFRAAKTAGVPIIPIVVSNTHNKIKLNRLKNGLVIVEMLLPIETKDFADQSVHKLAIHCHRLMTERIKELNIEVEKRELLKS